MNFSGSSVSGSGSRGISLSNTVYSEVAPCLPLPSLPVFCGSSDQNFRLFDEPRPLNRQEVLAQSSRIAQLLQQTDVSYLHLKDDIKANHLEHVEASELYHEVLRCSSGAFEYSAAVSQVLSESKSLVVQCLLSSSLSQVFLLQVRLQETLMQLTIIFLLTFLSYPLRNQNSKRKVVMGSHRLDLILLNLKDACGRAEIYNDDRDEAEWLPLPLSDLRKLVNEITSIRAKDLLHLVPVNILVKVLKVLDHQIHRAEGLSVDECENSDVEVVSTILSALESIHAALAVMAYNHMPKQLYKEEIIERILEFIRRQIMDVMCACDPSYRAIHKPSDHSAFEDDLYDECDVEFGSASKKRRIGKTMKVKKSITNKASSAVNTILQKLCSLLGLLKDLLLIERLSDSCILQLVKTSFTTFLVDNIQILQLKAVSLITGIFYSYTQHRTYVIDEIVQLLWKLSNSKRAIRTYHLPDEDQRQIQMITALLIQLVHCSANLPDTLRQASSSTGIPEVPFDDSFPIKCYEATTEACCLFWSRILQRFTGGKNQDVSELKVIMENLVTDLLTTLNLPEYPASAPILEVLCVLLLHNAGLKSKDISARSMAIDLLGTVAARLKRDAVTCSREKFWIVQEYFNEDALDHSYPTDECSVCVGGSVEKLFFACQDCQRSFHADCMGVREPEVSNRSWYCPICLCRKQLLVLQSYCKTQLKDNMQRRHNVSGNDSEAPEKITKAEIVHQLLFNFLQDVSSSDDLHIFVRWFYLCLWYKDDPKAQQKFIYFLARLKSKAVVRDSWTASSLLTRDSVKKIALALGQNSSFSRGFDKILHLLLASLRENSPIIRAKALRAVSIIVEADPEVLGHNRVQSAVEGRFCDSAISVREAALELVGRHIASHPDVGFKYFEKIAERIKDTGVSVRKRAIKIIRDMCTSNANFSGFTRACIEIISRVSDDESSIQDLVCRTFYEFWFEEPCSSQTQLFGDGSSVPFEVAKKTEQIVDMLRRMPNHQLLVTVIKRNLSLDFFPQSAKAAGINPVSLATVRKRCELMCKCLLEKILQVEETNNEQVEVHALPYVLVLHAFCVVDPALCAPASNPSQFVVTLQPYLKSQVDNHVVARLLESIIFIIDAVLPSLRKLPQSIVNELEQDLKHMIVRHSFLTVVHACIKCLCSVNKISGKGAGVIEYLILLFFKRLDAQTVDNKQQVGRSLFCLGLLIRYGNYLLTNYGSRTFDIRSSLSLFKRYLSVEDIDIRVRSVQALGFVLIARPDFMLEKDIGKILEGTLSADTNVRLKMQALQNIFEYLIDAESHMETDKVADDQVEAGHSVPVAAGAGDTNICGGIIQLYWDDILGRCLDLDGRLRQSALKIVEVVLRQGLVHPITCVPYLIALETDPQEVNAKLAHHLLMNMNEKYPAFFESRLGDGLQMSFTFIQSISCISENGNNKGQTQVFANGKGKSDLSSFTQARHGVSRIYKLIRLNRLSRNKFMSSIVRKFDNPCRNDSVIPFLTYCTEVLALLPFTSIDEPLYLIYAINRVVQVRVGPLEANMKALASYFLQRENGICQQGPGELSFQNHMTSSNLNATVEQDVDSEPAYNHLAFDLNGIIKQQSGDHLLEHGMTGQTFHISGLNDSSGVSKDDLPNLEANCLSAIALQLLLKLKRHLKIMYSLNDARCQAYSPNEPPKSVEVLTRQNITFDVGDMHFSLPTTSQELLQRYQEFKNALKEDTIDYAIYTANIKRKRPAPRGRRKSGHAPTGNYYEEDDYNDDDDWTGGIRRASNSGRRGSRQHR